MPLSEADTCRKKEHRITEIVGRIKALLEKPS